MLSILLDFIRGLFHVLHQHLSTNSTSVVPIVQTEHLTNVLLLYGTQDQYKLEMDRSYQLLEALHTVRIGVLLWVETRVGTMIVGGM
jgi:hypothetical protein